MIKHTIGLFACLIPACALACGVDEKAVFSCQTDTNKQIQVCQGPSAIYYRYGNPSQKPDLTIVQKNESFVWEHGEGASAGVGDSLVFTKGSTEYLLSHVASFDEPSQISAHLTIMKPGTDPAYIECASGIRFTPAHIKARSREMTERVPSL